MRLGVIVTARHNRINGHPEGLVGLARSNVSVVQYLQGRYPKILHHQGFFDPNTVPPKPRINIGGSVVIGAQGNPGPRTDPILKNNSTIIRRIQGGHNASTQLHAVQNHIGKDGTASNDRGFLNLRYAVNATVHDPKQAEGLNGIGLHTVVVLVIRCADVIVVIRPVLGEKRARNGRLKRIRGYQGHGQGIVNPSAYTGGIKQLGGGYRAIQVHNTGPNGDRIGSSGDRWIRFPSTNERRRGHDRTQIRRRQGNNFVTRVQGSKIGFSDHTAHVRKDLALLYKNRSTWIGWNGCRGRHKRGAEKTDRIPHIDLGTRSISKHPTHPSSTERADIGHQNIVKLNIHALVTLSGWLLDLLRNGRVVGIVNHEQIHEGRARCRWGRKTQNRTGHPNQIQLGFPGIG